MKTVQIVVYSTDTEEVLSVGDLELPSKPCDEQQNSHDVANEILEEFGMECCAWLPLFKNEQTEIWQALLVSGMDDAALVNPDLNPQMLAIDFVDCKTNGSWQRKMMRHNIPRFIADDLFDKFEQKRLERKKSYVSDEEEDDSTIEV